MLEYDLEIKPKKLIKGQGLAKLMAESNLHALDINLIAALSEEQEEDDHFLQVFNMFMSSPWYSDMVFNILGGVLILASHICWNFPFPLISKGERIWSIWR